MATRTVTITDVAGVAGVSVATVSRALRNLPGVAEDTRARVTEAARRLGYVMAPSPNGRSFGGQARVAVVVPRLGTWFFGGLVAALVARLSDFDLISELQVLADGADRSRFFACAPLRRRVRAVVVVGMSLTGYEIGSMKSLGVPVVGVHTNLPQPCVQLDDVAMARCAVDHLIGLGHSRIAMICSVGGCGPTDEAPSAAGTAPVWSAHVVPRLRSAGYREALREARIDLDPTLVLSGDDTAVGGARAMSALVARRDVPSAVFVHTDEMAFGAITVLRRAGLEVPAGMSVVSIDNSRLASAFRLTSVAQQVEEQGREAADLVVLALTSAVGERAGSGGAGAPRATTAPVVGGSPHPPRLVVRGSTAPPASLRRR